MQSLSPKAVELLGALLEQRPEALSKQQLRDRVWPDTHVTDTSLSRVVGELRSALGDDARRPKLIRTVQRFGYAFCGAAEEAAVARSARPAPFACWLIRDRERIELPEGEHLLGRDTDVLVQIASPSASRHHARIRVAAGRAVLEDLDSKNGTFLGGERIAEPIELADHSEIRIGSEVLIFRCVAATQRTETATPR